MATSLSAQSPLFGDGSAQGTFVLQSDGFNTQLSIEIAGAAGMSSSSSSCSTGAWAAQPRLLCDGSSRAAILVQGTASTVVFAVQITPGGSSVSSVSMPAGAFEQNFPGLAPLEWQPAR